MAFIDFFRKQKPITEIMQPQNDEFKLFEQTKLAKKSFLQQRDANEYELMTLEQQLRKLDLQAKIQEKEEELFGVEEEETPSGDNPDAMLYGLLSKVLTQNQSSPQQINPTVSTNTSSHDVGGTSLNDDEIQTIYNDLPTVYKTIAKSLSDEQIKDFIKKKQPSLNEDTLNRAIAIIRK